MAKYIEKVDPNVVNALIQAKSFSPLGALAQTAGQVVGQVSQASRLKAEKEKELDVKAMQIMSNMKENFDMVPIKDGKMPEGAIQLPESFQKRYGNVALVPKPKKPQEDKTMVKITPAIAKLAKERSGVDFIVDEKQDRDFVMQAIKKEKPSSGKSDYDKTMEGNIKQIRSMENTLSNLKKLKEEKTISDTEYNRRLGQIMPTIERLQKETFGIKDEVLTPEQQGQKSSILATIKKMMSAIGGLAGTVGNAIGSLGSNTEDKTVTNKDTKETPVTTKPDYMNIYKDAMKRRLGE